jgi:hypothetical protein
MTSMSRKDETRNVEVHIYLTPTEKAALQKQAQRDCRSVNGQVLHYIKLGLEIDGRNLRERR